MKAQAILRALVACFATLTVAEPNCRQSGIYFQHPVHCNKFLACQLGNLEELSCPDGTFWNDSIKACGPNGNLECISKTVADNTTDPVPNGKCPDTYDPNHQVYLPHADCTKYYICTWGGEALEQSCPPNLHWNQKLSYCDFPAQAGCTAEIFAPALPPVIASGCPPVYDPNHQFYFPHADCTKYYICTHEGKKLEQICPVGLHWSQTQSYCDHPELAQCTTTKDNDFGTAYHDIFIIAIEQSASTVSVPKCPMLEYDEEDQPAFFPHPIDCTKYYVCSHGYPYEMNCPVGTFWNSKVDACDAPENSECVSKIEPTMIQV